MIPPKMNAMVLTGHGGMEKLVWHQDWPTPKPTEGEVLLRVLACGLNNTDVNTRAGWYSKTVTEATTGDAQTTTDEDPSWGGSAISFPRVQGADVCGEVVEGPAHLIGKRVILECWLRDWSAPMDFGKTGYVGSERDGGFAQYMTIDARNVGVVDCDLSDAELATFSCSYTTAEGMLSRAGVSGADTVMVTGASGGVGSALIQLAKRRGAIVVALASEGKHDRLKDLGADVLLPRTPEDLPQALHQAIGRPEVDVLADIVGGPAFPSLIECLARGGHYVTSGAIAGPIVDLDLRTLYLRDLTFHGSTVVQPEIFQNLLRYIEAREIKPLLAASYPLKDLHKAQQAFIDKAHVGNIVVVP